MTPIRIPYIEKALETSINTLEGFENHKCKILQAKLSGFSKPEFFLAGI